MKQVIGKPKPLVVSEPLNLWLENHGGHEGVVISLNAQMANGGVYELIATDEEGKVWVGSSLSICLGYFNEHGSFILNAKFIGR